MFISKVTIGFQGIMQDIETDLYSLYVFLTLNVFFIVKIKKKDLRMYCIAFELCLVVVCHRGCVVYCDACCLLLSSTVFKPSD